MIASLRAQAAARLGRLPYGAALLVVGFVQTVALAWMLGDRITLLRSDREITLSPQPVDPRDLFRGDYVILRYGVSEAPVDTVAGPEGPEVKEGTSHPLWAVIEPEPADGWRVTALHRDRPEPASADAVTLRAIGTRYRESWSLDYGLGRYYVPEGEGLKLEEMVRDRAIEITVAVGADGRAAIKGLKADGETLFEEPWF